MPWLDEPFNEIDVEVVYNKDKNLHKEDAIVIIDWVKNQPHLPEITEFQILLFLHSEYYDVEKAEILIDKYFTIKTLNPELFGSRTLKDPVLESSTRCILVAPLSRLTSSGDLVIVGKLMDTNSSNYSPEGQVKYFDVITLLCFHQIGPVDGLQIIADLSNSSFSHFTKLTTKIITAFMSYLQEGMPVRMKYVHLINVSYFVEKFLVLIRPFIKKEVFELVKIHSKMENLYQYIPQDMLPQDYGGSSESTEILQQKIIRLIDSSEPFLKFQETQVSDLTKRADSPRASTRL